MQTQLCRRRRTGSHFVLPLALALIASLNLPEPGQARDLDEIVASGELTILTFPRQESVFSRTNLKQGRPMPRLGTADDFEGIDIELMAAFADHLGVELKIRPVSEPRYGALIPDLQAGRGDLIASSMSITDERREVVNFSRPYFEVFPVVITRADFELGPEDDLSALVGVVTAGSSSELRLRRMGAEPGTLVRVDFAVECYSKLLEGDADYMLADSLGALAYLEKERGLKIAYRLDERDQYAFVVRKDQPKLLAALDQFLDEAVSNGALDQILDRNRGPEQGGSLSSAGSLDSPK